MAKHEIQWASLPPLWPHATSVANANVRRAMLRQPTILRFATDTFMDDVAALLEQDPARLVEMIATPETWRGPVAAGTLPSVPRFARTMNRLGLANARAKDSALVPGGKGVSSLIATGAAAPPVKLKLYQPAHQRYYLVTSSLVCEQLGLPDHALNPGRQERATFVLRRMFPPGRLDITVALPNFNPDTWEEYAFVSTPSGNAWQRISEDNGTHPDELIAGEAQLPLFAMNYTQDDGLKRRIHAGLIPVGKREAFMGASFQKQQTDPDPVKEIPPTPDPRMHLFWAKVTEPWKKLLEQADSAVQLQTGSEIPDDPDDTPPVQTLLGDSLAKTLRNSREQIQTGSWYIVLDFANLLFEQTPRVWRLLNGEPSVAPDPPFNTQEQALVNAIANTTFDLSQAGALVQKTHYTTAQVAGSLKAALVAVKAGQIETKLEAVKTSYNRTPNPIDPKWPDFLFPLADPELAPPIPNLTIAPPATGGALESNRRRIDALAALIKDALPLTPVVPVPVNPLVSQQPIDMREGWFVIRCVFERPECGPIDPPVLSDPSAAFQMAGFFDPDAPARPIRIALPLDTSPAGLRKFDKNTAFMISDMLCGQINRVKGMSLGDLVLSVLPWPLHKDLPVGDSGPCTQSNDPNIEIGMICSLSIPIITICALLLLMIIVNLLDIIFRWVPFFIFCFPLPKFNSKSEA